MSKKDKTKRFKCFYCGRRLSGESRTKDHLVPKYLVRKKGQGHRVGNSVYACSPCNRRKGDRLPYIEECLKYLREYGKNPKYLWVVRLELKRERTYRQSLLTRK